METKTISHIEMALWLVWMDRAIEATLTGDSAGGLFWFKEVRRKMREASLADVAIETAAPLPQPAKE